MQALCEGRRYNYVAGLRSMSQGAAAETVLKDDEDFVNLVHYPIESVFSGARLRTNTARRIRRRDNAFYLVFKLVRCQAPNKNCTSGAELYH